MKDYEKYEQELRAEFTAENPNATPIQLAENYRQNTGLVMAFLAAKNFKAIKEGRPILIEDWLRSAWRGSRVSSQELER